MILLPAIDIHKGQCVRLVQGDFSTAHQVAADPLETALSFRRAGAKWLHMVDLDGAKEGRRVNEALFLKVARDSGLELELGGGIRTMEDITFYLENGTSRVILGSVALRNPQLVRQAADQWGARIAVGIDARDGMVATEGWLEGSNVSYLDLAKAMEQAGVRTIIYTDIARDGTLSGVNLEQLEALSKAVSCRIIASGGVRNLEDIRACKELGLYGAICGKSLYSGSLSLAEALETAGE